MTKEQLDALEKEILHHYWNRDLEGIQRLFRILREKLNGNS